MTLARLLLFVLPVASADPPPMSAAQLEAAKEAARQSIREGEQHQLQSKYWQTYDTPAFTLVVPSYADPTTAKNPVGSSWTLDLAGDYVVTVHHPKSQDASQVVTTALSKYPGATVVAEDTPTGRVFHIDHRQTSALLGVHQEPLLLVELTAPAGQLDATVATRVWQGFSAK